MAEQVNLEAKFLGGLVGSALGDAIGELAFASPDESQLRAAINATDTLIYTDDTAMAIGLAESLSQMGHLDEQNLGDTFRANFNREPWRGYAIGPPTIFNLVEQKGMSYSEAAGSMFGGQGSFGNGAAMRIAPVGLFFHNAPNLVQQAGASAAVTHAHPIGKDGAAVLATAVAQAVNLNPKAPFSVDSFGRQLVDVAQTPELRHKMEMVTHLVADDAPPAKAAGRLGRTVAMHESMPFAVYAFLKHPHSFEACLFCAILNGGDRDTLGAMACAISGAYLGVEAIPAEWRTKLENRAYIESLVRKLFNLCNKVE